MIKKILSKISPPNETSEQTNFEAKLKKFGSERVESGRNIMV